MELGIYKHYKGKFYQVFDLGRHSENLEEMVVYEALYGMCDTWVSPKSKFEEKVVLETGEEVSKFVLISSVDDEEEWEDGELITMFDNKLDFQRAAKILEKNEVDFEVREEKLESKPSYLASSTLYKIFVDEENFEIAMKLLNG